MKMLPPIVPHASLKDDFGATITYGGSDKGTQLVSGII